MVFLSPLAPHQAIRQIQVRLNYIAEAHPLSPMTPTRSKTQARNLRLLTFQILCSRSSAVVPVD